MAVDTTSDGRVVFMEGLGTQQYTYVREVDLNTKKLLTLGKINDPRGIAMLGNNTAVFVDSAHMAKVDLSMSFPCKMNHWLTQGLQHIPVRKEGELQMYDNYVHGVTTKSGRYGFKGFRKIAKVGDFKYEKNTVCYWPCKEADKAKCKLHQAECCVAKAPLEDKNYAGDHPKFVKLAPKEKRPSRRDELLMF
jgi:hypothetical protein